MTSVTNTAEDTWDVTEIFAICTQKKSILNVTKYWMTMKTNLFQLTCTLRIIDFLNKQLYTGPDTLCFGYYNVTASECSSSYEDVQESEVSAKTATADEGSLLTKLKKYIKIDCPCYLCYK